MHNKLSLIQGHIGMALSLALEIDDVEIDELIQSLADTSCFAVTAIIDEAQGLNHNATVIKVDFNRRET